MDTFWSSPGIGVRGSNSQAPSSREAPILRIQTPAAKFLASRVTLEPGASLVIVLANLRLCRRTRGVRQFREWSERCVERQPDSPHPDPLPRGEGTVGGRFGCSGV